MMNKRTVFYLVLITLFLAVGLYQCGSAPNFSNSKAKPIEHGLWDDLLGDYVDEKGTVDYKGFVKDKERLSKYLDLLSANPPAKEWSKNEKLAYWINAYNAFTIKLIVDNYPVESIRDLHPTVSIPLVNTVWHIEFFKIGGQDMNLNTIEHLILRKDFEEPRIHFAIVCASKSCPKLLNKAFEADKLEAQLDAQARAFVNDNFRNQISTDKVLLSKLFSWFKGDFTKKGSLIDFINQYSETPINKELKIDYLDYDWTLNGL